MRRVLIMLLTGVLASSISCADQVRTAPAGDKVMAMPSLAAAKPVPPNPRVGAVFVGGESLHTCTGAVLNSPAGDLILTAAHCLAAGTDSFFVPGLASKAADPEYFHVDAIYLDPRWVSGQDPVADFAVARVSRQGSTSVEAQASGGFDLGSAPTSGADVTVTGYPASIGGDPVGCDTRTASADRGFPSLLCAGLVDGTSGAPWVAGSVISGIIGGLEGGGCEENVSYSPPFDDAVKQLLVRAEAGGPGDEAPAVAVDDC
jgi:hypothetical protein